MRNNTVVRGVQTLFDAGTATGLSDGQLLERYLRRGDDSAEAAFRALVERHGPMVLRTCRGVLRDSHAAEDAFQATFLILARKARSIRKRDSVASWLFGVARRVAGRAASQRKRRAVYEGQGVAMAEAAARSSASDGPHGTGSEVQEEVDRLPERYRAPIVLCYLEGLTQEEAAIRLHLPASTVRVRLMRARSRLRDRLIRRGLAPGALAGLAAGRAEAVMPTPLVDETVKAAIRIAAGRAAWASAPIAALVEGVIRAMFLSKLATAAALLAALTGASLGIIASLAGPAPLAQAPPAAKASAEVAKPTTKPQDPGDEIAVATVTRARWNQSIMLSATVKACDSVNLYARVSGYLTSVKVDIGSRVKKGDLLAEIDDHQLAVAVERARAEVERAEARVKKAEAAIEVARAAAGVERVRAQVATKAGDRTEGPVARAAELEALARIAMAQADHVEAKSELRIARTGLDDARTTAEYTKIRAPYDGIVTRRNYHAGALVRSTGAGDVVPIFTVVRTDRMLIAVSVPENQALDLDAGDRATVEIHALRDHGKFEGRIARTAYAIDPQNGTLRAEIDLPNDDGRLRPGLSGTITVVLVNKENVITIPRSALTALSSDGTGECFRVLDGHAVLTPIKVGLRDGEQAEVIEGLKEGDVVVSKGANRMSDGKPIKIRPEGHGPTGR